MGSYNNPNEYIKSKVISIPDFPKKGIIFRDVTGILDDESTFHICNSLLSNKAIMDFKLEFDVVAGIEARGFIFGSVLANTHHKRFIPVRKFGKLPRETVSETYDLEYGKSIIEIHKDSIKPGDRVLLVDDLLATGGTLNAAARLVEKLGGIVSGILCVIDLPDLGGRELLKSKGYKVVTICSFEGE